MKTTLSQDQLQELLKSEPNWKLADGALTREWTLPDFVAAMAFVNQIATLAEAAGHHPDIDIRYNRVRLALISHDAGGITERDANMAKRISGI
jgi:4a-hydroxytetrahydrobiopterin dehydratase